ncbi:MAG: hypothetical protein EP344_01340 [Bacteroidetes bacterium]|nr:MAG: hypothetical protein EP344_01340 [Bacteroidota bacterium]
MATQTALYPDCYYHIYNRGNNRQQVFFRPHDYLLFLERYSRYIAPVVRTYAYCLLPNHFHLLIQVRPEDVLLPLVEQKDSAFKDRIRNLPEFVSDQFSNWFNSFTRTMNNQYGREGNLFKRPFQRIEVNDEVYLTQLIWYIHFNPQKHRLCRDFRRWKYSSYPGLLSSKPTRVERNAVLEWFGGKDAFQFFHEDGMDEGDLGDFRLEG